MSKPAVICTHCGALLEGYLASHLCPQCQTPQVVRDGETYFTALGLPVGFAIDLNLAQSRFYEISRALHPDRFISSNPAQKTLSISRMSFLNQAFQTLKSRSLLRDYVLRLYGVREPQMPRGESSQTKAQIPADVAEAWFELQELVFDDPTAAAARLAEFKSLLTELKTQSEAQLSQLEVQFDSVESKSASPEILGILRKMDAELQKQNYFNSIEKDVERIKKNVG